MFKRMLYLNEGIDIDYANNTVAYNPNNDDIVDTSVDNNPSKDSGVLNQKSFKDRRKRGNVAPIIDTLCNGVEVWSIFKRKSITSMDGNPLIYAFKNEHGWKFKSNRDYNNIVNQIHLIAEKFAKEHKYSAVLIVPSSKNVNDMVAKIVSSKLTQCQYVEGVLRKMYIGEVCDYVLEPNSLFKKYYKTNFDSAFDLFKYYLNKMVTDTRNPENSVYRRHLISDSKMRSVVDQTLTVSDPSAYHSEINDNDILIIDDIISRGDSIKESIKVIKSTYKPKSITVMTLLSAKA